MHIPKALGLLIFLCTTLENQADVLMAPATTTLDGVSNSVLGNYIYVESPFSIDVHSVPAHWQRYGRCVHFRACEIFELHSANDEPLLAAQIVLLGLTQLAMALFNFRAYN